MFLVILKAIKENIDYFNKKVVLKVSLTNRHQTDEENYNMWGKWVQFNVTVNKMEKLISSVFLLQRNEGKSPIDKSTHFGRITNIWKSDT